MCCRYKINESYLTSSVVYRARDKKFMLGLNTLEGWQCKQQKLIHRLVEQKDTMDVMHKNRDFAWLCYSLLISICLPHCDL